MPGSGIVSAVASARAGRPSADTADAPRSAARLRAPHTFMAPRLGPCWRLEHRSLLMSRENNVKAEHAD
jgi:hypothetical protein